LAFFNQISNFKSFKGFAADDLLKLNHNLNIKDKVEEGTRILLPADVLSEHDKEIIAGIGGRYRTYPVRKGETVEDIISARGITMEELELLNPELNVKKGVKRKLHLCQDIDILYLQRTLP